MRKSRHSETEVVKTVSQLDSHLSADVYVENMVYLLVLFIIGDQSTVVWIQVILNA